jgi:PAS domain-containing protein
MPERSPLDPDQYRLILNSLSEGVCTVDRDWNITSFNHAAQALTGMPVKEALKLSFSDIFRCEVCECRSLLAEVMESGGGGRGKQGQRGRAKLGHLSPKNSAPLGAIQAKSGLLLATPAACRPPTLLSVGDRR